MRGRAELFIHVRFQVPELLAGHTFSLNLSFW